MFGAQGFYGLEFFILNQMIVVWVSFYFVLHMSYGLVGLKASFQP